MENKRKYLQYAYEVNKLISPLEISDNGLSELEEQIENAELIVPVVGGFSAGKSTLINSFLGEDILATAVTPETALATELRYSSENYIESVNDNGSITRHEITDFNSLKDNAKTIQYLRVYLNSEKLKSIQPLVLVDMPGFDSPIENHHKAILNYLNRGVYFVFLTTIEDGNISNSMKREIDNLQHFGKGFSFCLSKTNLRPENDVNAVSAQISDQLEDFFDYKEEVVLLDENGGSNLERILKSINPELLFEKIFLNRLKDNYIEIEQSLNVKISTFKGNKEEAEKTVLSLQESINKINSKMKSAIADIEGRYSNQKIDLIADRASSALMAVRNRLIDLALNSSDAFAREVNEVIQNSLLTNTQAQLASIGSDIVSDIGSDLKISLGESLILDDSFVGKISQVTESFLHQAQEGLASLSSKMNDKSDNTNNNAKNAYRAIASIVAITTSVVAPIVEIIIVFLPDIIALFTQKSQEEKVREQRAEVEKQIVNKIIPEIRLKIKQALPAEFNKQVALLISEVTQKFEALLKQKQEEIEQASAEKQEREAEIEQEIKTLEDNKKELLNLANQYLFK